jgi:serine protease
MANMFRRVGVIGAAVGALLVLLSPPSSGAPKSPGHNCINPAGHPVPGQCEKLPPTTTATTAQPTRFTNSANVPIPNPGTAESLITVDLAGSAPASLDVAVDIKHTYRGDLVIDLIAPDGNAYRLKNSNSSDSGDDVLANYTVNASSEAAAGVWKLRVRDIFTADVGYIDEWSLQF